MTTNIYLKYYCILILNRVLDYPQKSQEIFLVIILDVFMNIFDFANLLKENIYFNGGNLKLLTIYFNIIFHIKIFFIKLFVSKI